MLPLTHWQDVNPPPANLHTLGPCRRHQCLYPCSQHYSYSPRERRDRPKSHGLDLQDNLDKLNDDIRSIQSDHCPVT
jgi:hypothetical protein